MTVDGERRVSGVNRVPLQTRVEMCGLDPQLAPAFEAESLDVSGRGLHLRTGYVPEMGTPLVCRFEDRGREILAEGVVAWVEPRSRGGEFGMMFTALDSGSVDALRELTGMFDAVTEDEVEEDDEHTEPQSLQLEPSVSAPVQSEPPPPPAPPRNEPGARVKLHIEGLGAPMKALVRNGTRSRVRVGSKLEFLKVGRRLEIENLDRNARRAARIDGVDVVLDPQSGVPQLVVALHYDDIDDVTPDPAVIDEEPETMVAPDVPTGSAAMAATEQSAAAPDYGDMVDGSEPREFDDEEEYDEYSQPPPEEEVALEAEAFQGKLNVAAQRAGVWAQRAGTVLARFGGAAAAGVTNFAREAGARVTDKGKRDQQAAPRRQTAPPPQGALSSDGRRLRPQQAPRANAQQPSEPSQKSSAGTRLVRSKPLRRAALGAVLLVTAVVLISFALRGRGEDGDPAAIAAAVETVAAAPAAAAPAAPSAAEQAAPDNHRRRLRDAPAQTKDGITANVPLFGPTPMATMEPAPLDPPPTAEDDAAPPAAKTRRVDDESFDDEIVRGDKSWGKGRLNLPTIHRIRLDGPGKVLKGSVNATGFSVVIPGRKTVEKGDAIARRDQRIARVSTTNSGEGARISFRFRDGVPPYRVRLRNDFVEFSISAPE